MALTGVILGDIAGSYLEENRRHLLRVQPNIDWGTYPFFKDDCCFTDDTVMTLAIKKAIDCHLPLVETMQEIGRHYMDSGYGRSFYNWIAGNYPMPYDSCGNGSAMRVSYIGEHYNTLEEVQLYAKMSAEISHNHPEGIKGAVVTATCVYMAKHGSSKEDIYQYVFSNYNSGLGYEFPVDKDMEYLKKHYSWGATCQTSVPVAIRCFYESDSYLSFLKNIAWLDCDSDTIGAIGGGIAEEYYKETVPDAEEIIKTHLSEELYNIYKGRY